MNDQYCTFIELGKALATDRKLSWDIALNDEGWAQDGIGWNLSVCAGEVAPPVFYLRDLGLDGKTAKSMNVEREKIGLPPLARTPLSVAWQDLIKAAVSINLFFKRNSVSYVAQSILRPLKLIATCVTKEPWELTLDDLRLAVMTGASLQASGKLGDLVIGVVKTVIDANRICDVGQLATLIGINRIPVRSVASRHTMSTDELRAKLEDRKRSERLPERRAFWELVRIVMTERPASFVDELRFAALSTMVVTGFRIGEAALLPVDWRRERTFVDSKGRPAGEAGGLSTALMLRHFAEKQQDEESDSRLLTENVQPVPELFRELVTETLSRVATITQPLRDTLKLQCETGRILPWYKEADVVPIVELYTRLTGNPFWLQIDRQPFIEEYRQRFDPSVLARVHDFQKQIYARSPAKLDMALYMFGNRLQKQMRSCETALRFRDANGKIISDARMSWSETYLCVGELETYVRTLTPTKVSDLAPSHSTVGPIQPWEFMFLQPKRSLAEERNDGLCDVTRYISVSRPDPTFIGVALSSAKGSPSIFSKYGATEEDRLLKLESHMLRHLQNTELFRLGVADTIISKRFNRRSVTQSYEYDHRSLAEELDQIEIPSEIENILGEKAVTVARMIKAGKANGPIVDSFRQIQRDHGDVAAYEFLRVEADGFHATPYGHCLNSFTVDPCPKHLECFANCRHLSATDLPGNRQNLIRLEGKFNAAIETIKLRPSGSLGWKNQLEHAEQRLTGVRKLLDTKPGELVFPDGVDLSAPSTATILDD